MDPNANLAEQRAIVKRIQHSWDNCSDAGELTPAQLAEVSQDANELADLVNALDTWIAHGGFLPRDWSPKC